MNNSLTFAEVRDKIVARFLADVPQVDGMNVGYILDNEDNDATVPTATHIRFSVRNGASFQETIGEIGSRWFRRHGFVYATIFAPLNTANSVLDGVAQDMTDTFQGVKIPDTSIRFMGANYREEEVPEGKYFEGTLRIDFTFDQLL